MSWEEHEVRRQEEYRELQPQEVIEDQAAEIKRLEAELDEWKEQARFAIENEMRRQAQLAEMWAALEQVEPYLDAIICYASTMQEHDGNRVAHVVRQALATDAGKAAADVLEYAIKYVTGEHKGTTGLSSKVQVYLEQQRAYRNEGRDDETWPRKR